MKHIVLAVLSIFIFTIPAFSFTEQELTDHNCHPCAGNNGEDGWCCEMPFENVVCDDPVPDPDPTPSPLESIEIITDFSTPNNGEIWNDASGSSAEYTIENLKAGDYVFSVYGTGPDASSDSINFGLDGVLIGTITLDVWQSPGPKWSNKLQGGGEATLTIPDNGVHVINLFAREDGCEITKIKLEYKL